MDSKPWLTKKEWADNRIKSGAQITFIVMWVMALIWNALMIPLYMEFPELLEKARGEPITYVALVMPLAGIYILFLAIKYTLDWLNSGRTPLVLDPFPGSIGGHLGGSIETDISYTGQTQGKITVQCVYSYVSGSGKDRSRSESVKWQNTGVCHLDQSARGTVFKFRFDLPNDLPESDVEKRSQNYYFWRVLLEVESAKRELSRFFVVPVFRTAEQSLSMRSGTEDHRGTLEAAESGIDSVADIKSVPGGIEIWYAPFQRPMNGIFMLIFGFIFSGFGLLIGSVDAPLFFPIVFCIVGGLIALAGLHYLGKALLVSITHEGIRTRRFLFGYPISTKEIHKGNFSSFEIRQNGSMQSGGKTTIYYNLLASSKDGTKITVAERHTSRPEIELIQEKFEAALN
jgi:hypothetical protein